MSGLLYVGHPVGLDALGAKVPAVSVLMLHPSERVKAIKQAADDGICVFWSDPYVADVFPGDRIVVISRTGKAAPLTAHPEWASWSGAPCGEVWAMLGEDWVDEVNP